MYPYLNDKEFLRKMDLEERKVQYIKIIALDFKTEAEIAYLEGKATGGTANLNGSSSLRRTVSCSLLVDPNGIKKQGSNDIIFYNNITEIQNIISLNKKIKVEIGFENTLSWNESYYPEYKIVWIPLGLYIIKTATATKGNNGINISLTLNDKTALLNGDSGGTLPAAMVFSEQEVYSADAKTRTVKQVLFKDIIKYLVVDLGGEDPSRVIIQDIPPVIRKIVKWTGNSTLYFDSRSGKKNFTTNRSDIVAEGSPLPNGVYTFEYGQDCGYIAEDFYYPGTLEGAAGESISTILDKVKNALGNYEWFYDIWGFFHFQEKKNYINTSHATTIAELDRLGDGGYLSSKNLSKIGYTFDESNKKLLLNVSKSPQYQNIKNDFIVWGTKKTAAGVDKPIRYHLSFANKPTIQAEPRLCIVYEDYRGLQQVIVLNSTNMKVGAHSEETAEAKEYYYLIKNENQYAVEFWDEENSSFRIFEEWEVCYLKTNDWRTELYFLGLESNNKTFAKNYYSAELNAEWPKIYNVTAQKIGTKQYSGTEVPVYEGDYRDIDPSDYEYFLDFISGDNGGNIGLSQFNIDNIGRRTKIGKDNSANCVFSSNTALDILIVNADGDLRAEYENKISGYEIIQTNDEIYKNLVIGGKDSSAYDKIKELLIAHTHYNETVNLTIIPIYYLEPNTRIHVEDNDLGVGGDFFINSISLPLGIGTSNITCAKCIENTI